MTHNPFPDAYCLPDSTGLGSPYGLPDFSLAFSPQAQNLSNEGKRTVVLEGILFRVLEILEDIGGEAPFRILLAGGLARESFIGQGLAACLNRKVELLEESEGTLLGAAATITAGLPFRKLPETIPIFPAREGSYLQEKYRQWKRWMKEILPI